MRGTFANIRIRNHMLGPNGREGGYTIHYPSKEETSIYDAAMQYKQEGVPLVIFAGVEYGNGSSRDWAAKGTNLLGVRAVIAQSFERIHRSNLVGMGIIPFVFEEGTSWLSLGLKGDETVTIDGLANIRPRQKMVAKVVTGEGKTIEIPILCRIDTIDELTTSRTAAFCSTCCATSPPDRRTPGRNKRRAADHRSAALLYSVRSDLPFAEELPVEGHDAASAADIGQRHDLLANGKIDDAASSPRAGRWRRRRRKW